MELSVVFLALGGLFLVGLLADQLGRRTRLPRVTLLLICGLIVGRSGFDLLPPDVTTWYEFLSVAALTMVAFLLGGELTLENLGRHGRAILFVSGAIVVMTLPLVTGGLWMLGLPLGAAILLGAIATATAPAATEDALSQSGVTGGFATILRGVVAIDDAWGMLAFSLAMVAVQALAGSGGDASILLDAVWEIGGALALGLAIGVPGAYLTGRLTKGEPLQTEALGLVCLTAGLALWLDVSFLLAGMTVGTVIVNTARHHDYAFHEIKHIQWPFMMLFFLLAGATLEAEALIDLGVYGAGFVVFRILGRILGGWIGAALGGVPRDQRVWVGPALLPQAGVAIGMALVAAQEVPEYADLILSLTVGTTVVFELIGPLATIYAARRAGQAEPTKG